MSVRGEYLVLVFYMRWNTTLIMTNWNLKFTEFIVENSFWIFLIGILVSVVLTYPFTKWAPTVQASPNPPGEVYDLQSDIDAKFPTPVHIAGYVLEARPRDGKAGDVLTREVLLEFKNNLTDLILLDQNEELAVGTLEPQTYLYQYFDYDICLLYTSPSPRDRG